LALAERFVEVDRSTPMLLPADLRDWVPEDDLVHFVIEAVKTLPSGEFVVNERGTGYAQYPPSMMLALLIYCYANGIFSSRRIERATYRDLGVRFLTGDTHPDHDTICSFRRQNEKLIAKFFVRVLELARELKLLQVGTISVDGTRLKANASKHRGVSSQRSGQLIKQLEEDVKELLRQAERADSQGEMDPARLPEEIAKRQELKAKLEAARQQLEERHREEFAAETAQYEKKKQKWENNDRRGHEPKPPASSGPDPKSQSNLTDPDSRIMRKSKNEAFAQAYNPQLAVDADGSQLVLGAYVSQISADNNELKPMLEAVSQNLGQKPQAVLADRGYINGPVIEQIQAQGIEAYVALSAEAYERRPYDLHSEEKRRENPRQSRLRRFGVPGLPGVPVRSRRCSDATAMTSSTGADENRVRCPAHLPPGKGAPRFPVRKECLRRPGAIALRCQWRSLPQSVAERWDRPLGHFPGDWSGRRIRKARNECRDSE
jgi:transposase